MKKETKERNPLLKGQKFGKLTVIELDHIEKHKRKDGQKENFEKRLHTYLKRYGLSKLHTWTYLVD